MTTIYSGPTTQYRIATVVRSADQLTNSSNGDVYYGFLSLSKPWDRQYPDIRYGTGRTILGDRDPGGGIGPLIDTVFDTDITLADQGTYFKRIANGDVYPMVKRYDWISNTVYTTYSDQLELVDQNFYCVVDEGGYYHVYKCLDNNGNAAATVRPAFADVAGAAAEPYYETSDGYQWFYMYSVDQLTFDRFATTEHIPIVANTTVADAAVPGAIHGFKVIAPGLYYNNYLTSDDESGIPFRTKDLRVLSTTQPTVPTNLVYGLDDSAAAANDYYNGCYLYIVSSDVSGVAGQYRKIVDYVVEPTQKVAILESAFSAPPDSTARYKIYPAVNVYGNGTETVNCIAWAIVNPDAANSVSRVEVLNKGAGYLVASANVYIHPSVANTTHSTLYSWNVSVSGVTGTFVIGQTVTGNLTGNRGTIINVVNSSATSKYLQIGSTSSLVSWDGDTTITSSGGAAGTVGTVRYLYLDTEGGLAANVIPVLPPPGGHGANAAGELYAKYLGISFKLTGDEDGNVPLKTTYRQIGVIRNPRYANVELRISKQDTVAGSEGTFSAEEVAKQIKITKLAGSVTTNTTSTVIIGSSTDFSSFSNTDYLYLRNGTTHHYGKINVVSNSTYLTLASNVDFTDTGVEAYLATTIASGTIKLPAGTASNTVYLDDVTGVLQTGYPLIGMTTMAYGNVDVIRINGNDKSDGFTYLNNMVVLTGTFDGSAWNDEQFDGVRVCQFDAANTVLTTLRAELQAVVDNGDGTYNVLINNVRGSPDTAKPLYRYDILSTNSTEGLDRITRYRTPVFNFTAKYSSEIVPLSGTIVYQSNRDAVYRWTVGSTESHNFRFVLEH